MVMEPAACVDSGSLAAKRAVAVDHGVASALAVTTGALYFLGFAGADLWPCAFVSLAPLALAMHGRSARQCLALGALAGFSMNVLGMYWLPRTLESFTALPGWLSWILTLLACGYQAGRIALFGWLYARARSFGWPHALVFLLAFVASELMYPALVPWYFAASVHQWPALTQLAELGGPYLVGLMLVAPNLAIAELVLCRLMRRRCHLALVVVGVLTPVAAAALGSLRIQQIEASMRDAELLRVGLVQANMPLRQSRGDHLEAMRRHLRMSQELQQKGVGLTIWSESVLKNLPPNPVPYLEQRFHGRLHAPTLVGAFVSGGRGRPANAALLIEGGGRVVGRYDKQRLLPFAETIPLLHSFPFLSAWLGSPGHLEPGRSVDPVFVAGHPVTILICYEDMLPEFVNRAVSQARSELLVNLTNDGWFGDTTAPWIHLALSKFRAIEHRRYLIRSTNSGVSAVVDPVGRVIARARMFEQQTLQAEVRWMTGSKTGYELWGDGPWWAASALIVALALYPPRGRASVRALMKRPQGLDQAPRRAS